MKTNIKVTRTIPVQQHTANVEVFELEIPDREVIDTLALLKKKDGEKDGIQLAKEATARALATTNSAKKVLAGLWCWSKEGEGEIKNAEDLEKILAQLSVDGKKARHATFDEAATFAVVEEWSSFNAYGEKDGTISWYPGYGEGPPWYFSFKEEDIGAAIAETLRVDESNKALGSWAVRNHHCLIIFE